MFELFQKQQVKRNKPVNIIAADEIFFKHEYEMEIPSSHYIILKDIFLLSDTVFSLKTFRFYWDYTHFVVPGLRNKLSRIRLLFKKRTNIPRAIWIANEWSEGYFHWLTDALPRLLAVKEKTDCRLIVLPEKYAALDYVKETISRLGFSAQCYNERYPCTVQELIVPSYTAPTGNYNITLINQLRNEFMLQRKPERRIYISRKKAKFRRILNEEVLEEVLKEYAFEIHFFEDYSFDKQVEMMSETSVLIGLHGAGLTNMLFMREGTKVVELRNEKDDKNNCYFSLASALGIAYYYQFNKGDTTETYNVGITVDPGRIRENLEQLFI